MQFTKIRLTDTAVELIWNDNTETDKQITELSSTDLPEPSFTEALQAFLPDVLSLLELPAGYDVTVRSVSIKYKGEADRRGIVVTCLKEIEAVNSPFVIHTPLVMERVEDDEYEDSFIGDGLFDQLTVLTDEAQRYLDGHRAQGDLDFEEDPQPNLGRVPDPPEPEPVHV